jgi:hypothetical protein
MATCRSTSVATAAVTSSQSDTLSLSSNTKFDMGGFEDLDSEGNELVDKKYPKYTGVKAEARGQRGLQVRDSKSSFTIVYSTSDSPW